MTQEHKWHLMRLGGCSQVCLENAADLQALKDLDRNYWTVLALGTRDLRFDARTLALLDARETGRITQVDLIAALDFLQAQGVNLESLFTPDAQDAAALKDLMSKPDHSLDQERILRYKLHLLELLENTLNQKRLYSCAGAICQTGTLHLDGRAFELCFPVADEEAHAALADHSKCCLVYAKLTRKESPDPRTVCAVVTTGRTFSLYVGRNGLFFDRDGLAWDAVVTRVIEAPVSLSEAFWLPWRRLAATIAETARKFISNKGTAAVAKVQKPDPAMLTSGVAALGMGMGMLGAGTAGILGVIAGLPPHKVALGIVTLVLMVSLPSVLLAWFKLRQRDLGAILNASGWAVNRPLRLSPYFAKTFTRKATLKS